MKKILATLLVATMLLSCISFVGFAADVSVNTISKFQFDDMTTTKKGKNVNYNDDFVNAYYDYYSEIAEWDDETDNWASPILCFLDENCVENNETSGTPITVTPDDVVLFPIYAKNVQTTTVDIAWDTDYLTFVDVGGEYSPGVKDGTLNQSAGTATVACITSLANDIDGLGLYVIFNIKEGAKGDKDGNATTAITMAFNPVNKTVSRVDPAATPALGTSSMSVSLTGLEKVAEPVEDVYMTETEVKEAATSATAVSKADYASNWAGSMTIVSGDDKDVTDAEAYSAVFATIAVPTGKKVDARGFVLIDAEGNETFYAADASTITAAGQFGMAFFGTKDSLGKYSYAPAAKVDGKVVYDASKKAAL